MRGRLWRVASTLVGLAAVALLTGACGDGDDDQAPAGDDGDDDNDDGKGPAPDDDDDEAPPWAALDLVFVDPIYWLERSEAEMAAELEAMQAQRVAGLIWRWTYCMGKTAYPSAAYVSFAAVGDGDPVGTLLRLAGERGLAVYLGLSAERETRDLYLDPLGPEATRNEAVVGELAARYGAHANLRGFYIPYEFTAAPTADEQTLLSLITQSVRARRGDWRVLTTVRYPGFARARVAQQLQANHWNYGFFLDQIDDAAERAAWAARTIEALDAAGVDVALLSTRVGSRLNDLAGAQRDRDALLAARDSAGSRLAVWTQLDLFDALGDPERALQPALGPLDRLTVASQLTAEAEGRVGFGWDQWRNVDGALSGASAAPEPDLLAKMELAREHLIGETLRDGQLITVGDTQYSPRLGPNVWQEDACWLTGLYLAAESFRYAVTGDPDSLAAAKAIARAALTLADASPKRGEVVRNWVRYFYGQTSPADPGAQKRWRKHPTKELYWLGDVSVDQLSGYFYGLATYYDLAADEADRAAVRSIVEAVVGDLLANDLHAVQFDGKPTTYGNLRATPELALDILLIAYHLTANEQYREAADRLTYDEYMDVHSIVYQWARHDVARLYDADHIQDSAYAHLFAYLDDPAAYRRWAWGLEYLFQGSYEFGNVYADFTHQMHMPDSAGAARALAELNAFDPDLLDNGQWFRKVNRTWEANSWIDLDQRPPKEFMWSWAPWGVTEVRGSPTYTFTGVEFLLVYWEGRYFGWVR